MIRIFSDNSDCLFIDEQSIILEDGDDKFLFTWFYGCSQCGRKNPHSAGNEELTLKQLLKRKGIHPELRKTLLKLYK